MTPSIAELRRLLADVQGPLAYADQIIEELPALLDRLEELERRDEYAANHPIPPELDARMDKLEKVAEAARATAAAVNLLLRVMSYDAESRAGHVDTVSTQLDDALAALDAEPAHV